MRTLPSCAKKYGVFLRFLSGIRGFTALKEKKTTFSLNFAEWGPDRNILRLIFEGSEPHLL